MEGWKRVNWRHAARPTSAMLKAAPPNITRQLQCSATKPLTTRDSRIPSSRPVITVPTILPRCDGGASVAAGVSHSKDF